MTIHQTQLNPERSDLLETLATHRFFLRKTTRDLTADQARARPTASELSLGGLVKHVAQGERTWVDFILGGAEAMTRGAPEDAGWSFWMGQFELLPEETLDGVLSAYDEVARRTDEVVATLPDLDVAHALPEAPWFKSGGTWSARRVLLHIVAETAQHAGHADIIRESLDGSKTMG